MVVAFLDIDFGVLALTLLVPVVGLGVAFFTATFGYLRATRAAAEPALRAQEAHELDHGPPLP